VGQAAGDPSLFERKRLEAQRKREIAELKRAGKVDPRSESILACVFGDPTTFDFLRERARDNVRQRDSFGSPLPKGVPTVARILNLEDVGVLFMMLGLILEHGGEVTLTDYAATVRFPDHELPPPERARRTLAHLSANGFLALKVDGGEAKVSYGPRVLSVCKQWGLTPEGLHPEAPDDVKEVVVATSA
jgi:hypothetical protein